MQSDYEFYASINYSVQGYRKRFLKRKNVNGYKKSPDGTPEIIDKLLNSFDRKIKGIPIFTDEVKKEYLKGLQKVFTEYYEEKYIPRISRHEAYCKYYASLYFVFGPKTFKAHVETFSNFVKNGWANKYR